MIIIDKPGPESEVLLTREQLLVGDTVVIVEDDKPSKYPYVIASDSNAVWLVSLGDSPLASKLMFCRPDACFRKVNLRVSVEPIC